MKLNKQHLSISMYTEIQKTDPTQENRILESPNKYIRAEELPPRYKHGQGGQHNKRQKQSQTPPAPIRVAI
jgi:hypothetical protein